jgi:hypothetical protein
MSVNDYPQEPRGAVRIPLAMVEVIEVMEAA